MSVLKTMWRHKAYVLPVLLLTLLAVGYVFQFGPRSYEANMSFAMVNPQVPTETELLEHPELAELNSDNPYLRSSDPALISDVLITRLSDRTMMESLEDAGLSPDYTVARSANGNGFVIDIVGVATAPEDAVATTRALGDVLVSELRAIQTVNGADDTYLFTALAISSPDRAEEQFSSRLRSVILVALAGGVLLFGAISLARALEVSGSRPAPGSPAPGTSTGGPGGSGSAGGTVSPNQVPYRARKVTGVRPSSEPERTRAGASHPAASTKSH